MQASFKIRYKDCWKTSNIGFHVLFYHVLKVLPTLILKKSIKILLKSFSFSFVKTLNLCIN